MDFSGLFELTGFGAITWQVMVMWCLVLGMLYLAVFKQFEPLLLVPIAFGALIANLPRKGVIETPPVALNSELDGVVTKVWVERGQKVIEQQALFEIRSEDGETHGVISKYNGSVSGIHVLAGQKVYYGESLIVTVQREVGG
ncbi:MAG: hypothetical protein HOI15_09895 [Opitutales bacterium]|nr:hypothetical protein [Opitutales bacterium]